MFDGWEGQTRTHHSISDLKSGNSDSVLLNEPIVVGVDEAGRGPVLGPMVYGIAFAPLNLLREVKNLGVDDSKKLSEHDRDSLFEAITCKSREWLGWSVTSICPSDISEGMLRRAKYSLNQQAFDVTVNLIRGIISLGVKVSEVYVDTVGSEKVYQSYLEQRFPGVSITVSKKADSKYPIVSAASIVAKVSRDYILKNWTYCENCSSPNSFSNKFGSGYPGDPKTLKWLRDCMDPVFGFPNLARFSWSTCAKYLGKHSVNVIWPDEDKPGPSVASYFVKTGPKKHAADSLSQIERSDVANVGDEGDEEVTSSDECSEGFGPLDGNEVRRLPLKRSKRKAGESFSDSESCRRIRVCEESLKQQRALILDQSRNALIKSIGLRHVVDF